MAPTDRHVSTQEFPVRYLETDMMGIVNHVWYIAWFESARIYYVHSRGAEYAEAQKEGVFLSVVDLHSRYVASARFGDTIAARCWVEKLGSRALTFAYEIANAHTGTLFATGQTYHIPLDSQGKAVMLPRSWRPWLEG